MTEARICAAEECENDISHKVWNAKYCCTECKDKPAICLSEGCRARVWRGHSYCKKHYGHLVSQAMSGENHPKWEGGYPKCVDCGKKTRLHQATRCIDCWQKLLRSQPSLHPRWKGGYPKCVDCGKGLSSRKSARCISCSNKFRRGTNSSRYKSGEFVKSQCLDCGKEINNSSKRCWECHLSFNVGENHIHWRGGYDAKYNRSFNKKLKKEIRMRDEYKCALCERDCSKDKRNPPVHHIDGNKMSGSKANLITLCDRCHKKVENRWHIEEKRIWYMNYFYQCLYERGEAIRSREWKSGA